MWIDPSAILLISASLRGIFVLSIQEGTSLGLFATRAYLIAHVVGPWADLPILTLYTLAAGQPCDKLSKGFHDAIKGHVIRDAEAFTPFQHLFSNLVYC